MLPWLTAQLETHPDKIGLYTINQSWTIAEIASEVDERAKRVMVFLSQNDKRVAILSHNSSDMYFLILALWSLGKEIVFLNTHLTTQELSYQLEDSGVKTIFVADDLKEKNFNHVQLIFFSDIHCQPLLDSISYPTFSVDATASIMYTSGTTGKPKGVIQTFRNHLASSMGTQKNMNITAQDVWGCAVPMFHISGLSIVVRQLVIGCGVYIFEKFDASLMSRLFKTGDITVSSVVNVMLKQLLQAYPKQGYSDKFKCLLVGGGPVSKEMLQDCFSKDIPVIQSFGMTETCSQVVALGYDDALQKIGSSGLPLDGISLVIRKNDETCEPMEIGEILLSGPNISPGYLNKSSSWTSDGYFKTGDLGYLDEDGYLYVVSRLSELIISGGENIYPAEVEQCIASLSGIMEVAVVGENDDTWGEVPVAYIVMDDTIDIEKINETCLNFLAKYKCPKKYYVVESLPRTASGKVAKRLLVNE